MRSAILELRKFVAPEVVFGARASHLAGQYARNFGAKRILVVTDQGLIDAGWAGQILDDLAGAGLETVLFSDVTPNPRDFEVMNGSRLYKEEGCDCIVAVGGGSPMDCAKGIGIASTNEKHVLDFEGVDNVASPGPPLICIPTTAGTSADVSQFSIILDTKRRVKIAIVSKTVVPDTALIDPALSATMDRELTANTGIDALTHAVEAYVSNACSPLTDLCALEAIRLIGQHLPWVIQEPDNILARSEMMHASMLAGFAFSNAILGAVHAMAHSLGGLMDLPHGLCNAILLDKVMELNYESAPKRYSEIGRALGAEVLEEAPLNEQKQATVEAVRVLKKKTGVDASLSDLGVAPENLAKLAANAMDDPCMATNPKAPTLEEIVQTYEKAL